MASRGQGVGKRGGAVVGQPSQIGQPTLESRPSDLRQFEAFSQDKVAISNARSCMSGKKGQGKTRNVTLVKRRHEGEKLSVDIPPNLMRVVGDNAQVLLLSLLQWGLRCGSKKPYLRKKWKNLKQNQTQMGKEKVGYSRIRDPIWVCEAHYENMIQTQLITSHSRDQSL